LLSQKITLLLIIQVCKALIPVKQEILFERSEFISCRELMWFRIIPPRAKQFFSVPASFGSFLTLRKEQDFSIVYPELFRGKEK
jgi:hypothetical protein